MFEYACDPEIAQNSNSLVSRDHVFFSEIAHFFQLENPEIAPFELSQDFGPEKVSHPRKKHVINISSSN